MVGLFHIYEYSFGYQNMEVTVSSLPIPYMISLQLSLDKEFSILLDIFLAMEFLCETLKLLFWYNEINFPLPYHISRSEILQFWRNRDNIKRSFTKNVRMIRNHNFTNLVCFRLFNTDISTHCDRYYHQNYS